MNTRMTWALSLVTLTLMGCGERNAPPVTQPHAAATATTTPSAPSTTVAAAPTTAPAVTAASLPPAPAKAAPAKVVVADAKLSVKRLVVARGVKGHEPIDAGSSFSAKDAGKIYAFIEVENEDRAPSEITVSFEPPGGGASRGNVKLAVGGEPRWRTWAFTRTARDVGAWTAVVKDHRGSVIARAPFEITL